MFGQIFVELNNMNGGLVCRYIRVKLIEKDLNETIR